MANTDDERMRIDNQLCFPLYAAARQVVSYYTSCLKALGLTYTQYIVFLVLWERDGLTVGELGQRLFLDNGTLTPLLKKLAAAGYLTRTRSAEDERVVRITLTEQGRALKEKALNIPEQIGRCIPLKAEEAAALYRLLYHILTPKEGKA